MTRKCELTGKIPLKGHTVSHANNKLKRKFLPNLKNVTFRSDVLKRNIIGKNSHLKSKQYFHDSRVLKYLENWFYFQHHQKAF